MIIKTIGTVLVIAGCGSVGFMIASAYRNEVKTAQKLLMSLEFLSCELKCRLLPLPELCAKTADFSSGVIKKVFIGLAAELEQQISPNTEKCMRVVLEQNPQIPSVTRNAFLRLGQTLGTFDMEGQLKGIETVCDEIRTNLQSLTTNQEVRLRSYQTLGLCAGAAIAILFL